jgi:hypothetical protein
MQAQEVLSQCSLPCSCFPVGHYKWFLVQFNELSHKKLSSAETRTDEKNTQPMGEREFVTVTINHV